MCLFDAAIAAKEDDGDLEKAEAMWRGCLEAGEMRAHFGLGYTLCDLGRPAEAFGHLAMYTEICPRNSWAWVWRGRAARDMGELAEARSCFETGDPLRGRVQRRRDRRGEVPQCARRHPGVRV